MCKKMLLIGGIYRSPNSFKEVFLIGTLSVVTGFGCTVEFEEKDLIENSTVHSDSDSDAQTDGGGWSSTPSDETGKNSDSGEDSGEDTRGDMDEDTAEVSEGNAGWFGDGWQYRRRITLLKSQIVGTHSFFPIVISTSLDSWRGSDHGGHVHQSDGGDFVFAGEDGENKLEHEIETYDDSTGKLVAWVKIPQVSSSENTAIYVYYGNSNTDLADQASHTRVWDDGGKNYFKGVWHLAETSTGNRGDSTQYANNCSCQGYDGNEAVDGKIGGADRLDGTDDWLTCGQSPSLNLRDELTISAWMKPSSTRIAKEKWVNGPWKPNSYGFYLYGQSDALTTLGIDFQINGTKKDVDDKGTIGIPMNVWTYLVVTYDGSAIKAYVDGKLDYTVSAPGTVDDSLAEILTVSETEKEGGIFLQGAVDEMRVSGKARSAEWIRTCFNNQKNPASFYTIGDEVAR